MIMLFIKTIVDVKACGLSHLKLLPSLCKIDKFQELDWCKFIYDFLRTSKVSWKPNNARNTYTGPALLLSLVYLYSLRHKNFESNPECPSLKYSSIDKIREREREREKSLKFIMKALELVKLYLSLLTMNHMK